jgi:uncharacterized protein YeeX (DUF496 family)
MSSIFRHISPHNPLKVNRQFEGTYRLHLQGRRINRVRNQRESRRQHAGFISWLENLTSYSDKIMSKSNVKTVIDVYYGTYERRNSSVGIAARHRVGTEKTGPSGHASHFEFGRCPVRISPGTPTTFTDIFKDFLQFLGINARGCLKSGHNGFLQHLQFVSQPLIRRHVA